MLKDYIDFYYSLDLNPTPIKARSKEPLLPAWPNARLSQSEWAAYGGAINIGVVLGASSGNCIDIDLDTPLAVTLGDALLPPTDFIYGRSSHPGSHRFYRVEGDAGKTVQFKHPDTGEMLIEYRANGAQSVVPGSYHKDTGEIIRFEDSGNGEPSMADRAALLRVCGLIAVACVFAERWQSGRHNAALAFAALCARHGVTEEACLRATNVICEEVRDEEADDRRQCVRTTFETWRQRKPMTSHAEIGACLGSARAADNAREWLGGKPERAVEPVRAASPSRMIDTTSDFTTGEAFCRHVEPRLLYCDDEDRFYYCTNGVYDPVSIAAVRRLVIDFLTESVPDTVAALDLARLKTLQSMRTVGSTIEYAKAHLRVSAAAFNNDPMLVGAQNGVIDLRTGALAEPTQIVTKRLGAALIVGSKCPRFESFLRDIFDNDEEKIAFVQRAVGYTLTGSVAAQVMFVAIGSGANGKSTLIKIVQALMRDYGTSLPPHTLMVAKYGNDKTDDLAMLNGRRFVSVSEGEAGSKLAVAKIKRMVGSDVISCRPLYRDYFDLKPEFKLWFQTNDLPQISGGDEAIWRRIHVIDFPVSFSPDQRDAGLYDKLAAELPGILNWALEGVRQIGDMQGDFLKPPASVTDATRQYRDTNDTIGEFINTCCEKFEDAFVMSNALYAQYELWMRSSGIDPVSNIVFGKELTRMGYEVKRTKLGNGRIGLKIL